MGQWLIRVEGVNFSQTVYDTNDLSTIRGGSLALLRLEEAVKESLKKCGVAEPEKIFSGASQCAFCFDYDGAADKLEADLRQQIADPKQIADSSEGTESPPPFDQVMTVLDVVPVENADKDAAKDAALRRAEARNHTRQFRSWTLLPVRFDLDASKDADPFELARPATETIWLPKGKILSPGDSGSQKKEQKVSLSVKARRDYGRQARQKFYSDELKDWKKNEEKFSFINAIEDIVAEPPPVLPVSVASKVAVVYADGNEFGKIRHDIGIPAFSEKLLSLRRELLATVLKWYVQGAKGRQHQAFAIQEQHKGEVRFGLRFETLLWGGDELCFVMPAWLACAFVKGFFAVTRDWAIKGHAPEEHALTHAVGVAIAHNKTPIRQLRTIAEEAANLAKEVIPRDNSVTFEIFESLALPDTGAGLKTMRAKAYGCDETDDSIARWLAIPGGGRGFDDKNFDRFDDKNFDRFDGRMYALAAGDDPFPRSQLYAALGAARKQCRRLVSDDDAAEAEAQLEAYTGRAGGKEQVYRLRNNLLPAFAGEGWGAPRPLSLALALIAQFWDYAHPFGADTVPSFPGLGPIDTDGGEG